MKLSNDGIQKITLSILKESFSIMSSSSANEIIFTPCIYLPILDGSSSIIKYGFKKLLFLIDSNKANPELPAPYKI